MCEIQVSIDSDVACRQSNSSALPLWMKEAEAELNSSDASSEDETNDDVRIFYNKIMTRKLVKTSHVEIF